MRAAYFDCPTGASGNMLLAALIDAGCPLAYLKKELKKLDLKNYKLLYTKVKRNGFGANHFDVKISDDGSRTINDIYRVIKKSRLSAKIKRSAHNIFKKLFEAEQKVHVGHTHMHIHEVGATDAIIDIVGTLIAIDKLGVEDIYCSALPFGTSDIQHCHGVLSNPAPATTLMLKGIPIYRKNTKIELVTPTGAVLLSTLTKSFTDMPKLDVKAIGFGAGTMDMPKEANILRVFVGDVATKFDEDLVLMIETNIDDMDPKVYDHAIQMLMKAGALDASISPIRMKKGRSGVILSVICRIDDKEKILDTIFKETTTIGVRTYLIKREKLKRKSVKVRTKFGKVSVKLGFAGNSIKNASPEYDDCVRLSKKLKMPAETIYDEAKAAYLKLNR
jgi:pyridinium-3,5-bisthiocarboxylic acid mononucleotide nickel chelatase